MTDGARDERVRPGRRSRRRFAAICAGVTLLLLALGGALVAASGLYNVAASRDHLAVTTLFLEFAMRRSVATHSMGIDSPRLDDPNLVRLGAGHFSGGCAPCHGAPGTPRSPVVQRMLPAPPPLGEAAHDWPPEQLFWIVKNGLKYTGMPAWVSQERDDEVWAVVAFLSELPEMSEEDYRALSGTVATVEGAADEVLPAPGDAGLAANCARCHGDGTAPPASRLVPKLAGQSAAYLEAALRSYAAGLRASGIMQAAVAELDEDAIGRLATYYAEMASAPGAAPVAAASAGRIERGRRIATSGIADSGIPACLVCHSGTSAATFPRLAGQHAPYLVAQLRLWQHGLRDRTAHGAIMAPIARRLTAMQIDDVAAYFQSLGVDPGLRDVRAGAQP